LDSGYVGIGTYTPSAPLDIYYTGTEAAPSVIFANDSDTGIYQPATDTLAFSIAGNEEIRITSNGLRFDGKTSDPALAQEGDVWYRSDTGNLKIYSDGRAQEISTVAVAQVYQTGTTTYSDTGYSAITWDGTNTSLRYVDSTYDHSTSVNPSQVTINDAGLYRVTYSISWDTTANQSRLSTCSLYVNGVSTNFGSSHAYGDNNTNDWGTNSTSFMYQFTASDYLEIQCTNTGTSGDITTTANESWLNVELVRRQ
jgi:hypothetical protein